MPTTPVDAADPSRVLHALDAAIEKSQEVKAEVEGCVQDLGSANDLAKIRLAQGETMLPAAQALHTGLSVELRAQACADDLQLVAETLAQGVDEVKAVEQALHLSRASLAETEAALADAQDALAASRRAARTASHMAMHDQKTGLPNRTLFDDRVAQAIAGAERHGWMLAVLFLDLDRFKRINDSHGHAAGDTVLTAVAERLMRHARDADTVCRNGGDEFLYLLINPSSRDAVARVAAAVQQAIGSPIGQGALQFQVTPSIGIALYPEHGLSGQTLIANADAAMYVAKQRGSVCEFFQPPTGQAVAART